MSLVLANVVWKAADPQRLATFWAGALSWKLANGSEVGVTAAHGKGRDGGTQALLIPTDPTGFRFSFRQTAETNSLPHQIHLDLSSSSLEDQEATVARCLRLGATHKDIGQTPDEPHVVLADPEGNAFCVLGPGNNFVTYASRMGCLTCNGSREVGVFWSQALERPLVWDRDGETAIRLGSGADQFVSWGGEDASERGSDRLTLEVEISGAGDSLSSEVQRLRELGARLIGPEPRASHGAGLVEVSPVTMVDPDGNRFRLVT